MKTPFTYTLLRYVHDIFTGEFLNVGIVLYAPKQGFLKAICTNYVSRASSIFPHLNSTSFRETLRFVNSHVNRLNNECFSELNRDSISALDVAKAVIPIDHSSFQWSQVGGGVTDNPENTLKDLYQRFVAKYEKPTPKKNNDLKIWRPFEKVLRAKHALSRLEDVTISHGDYDCHFEHAWKNGTWNLYQPVSFDLVEKRSIVDKAAHWGGRVKQLRKASTDFKIYLLVGKPKEPSLFDAFEQAERILHEDVPGEKEVVSEDQIPALATRVADQILSH